MKVLRIKDKLVERLPSDDYPNEYSGVIEIDKLNKVEICLRRNKDTAEPTLYIQALSKERPSSIRYRRKGEPIRVPSSIIETLIEHVDSANAICIEKDW